LNAVKAPLLLPDDYADWWAQVKGQIAPARQRAALAVNAELVQLYGRIGLDILQRQDAQGWGCQGHRPPGSRSEGRVPGHARVVIEQPQVHAVLCPLMLALPGRLAT
jgi:hypothetical protein